MTKSARIQEGVVEFLADGCPHTVQEIKSFYSKSEFLIIQRTVFRFDKYLLRNQSIKKVDRGIYK